MKATYTYITDGIKASAVDSAGNGFDYLGTFVYTNNNGNRALESTSFAGGRINKTNNSYDINYFITDHLGSTRVIVDNAGNIKEQKDYYPFGKEHENANLMSSTNRWGYNGKEKQIVGNLNYLDYINRMYDPEIGRWFVQDPLQEKYYSWSSYNYCMNNPVKYVDPDGREKYYAIDGSYLGQVGTNTDIRVINSTLTNTQANTHIQNGANNELTSNSVAFANYFTTVADVTNDAALQTYTNNGKNCFSAATAQLTDAGVTQTGAANAIHTLVADNSNLTSDAFGGAIRIQTELNNGNPVMVGVKETKNDGTVPNPGNNNSLTGHFVVIRSATVAANGSVTFNYLDNASTSSGKNANNNMTLDTSTGAITDEVVPARSNYQRYDVTEVRKNY